MRAKIAEQLIRWVSFPMDLSFQCHCKGLFSASEEYARIFKRRRWAVRLACRIHHDAATDRMACEGWWG